MGFTMAGALSGMAGGALTGGLEGGWKGMLIGAGIGGVMGGFGGWAAGVKYGGWIIGGMLVGGAAYAGVTDSWDSFLGGLVGGISGYATGKGFANSQQFQNWKAGNGFRSDAAVRAENKQIDNMKAALGLTHEEITPSQNSIDYVVEKYDLDTYDMLGQRPFYNKYQGWQGNTNIETRLVTIGPSAFESEGLLTSVIGHEGVHAYDLTTKGLYLTAPITEVNATGWQLTNATRLYNTPHEIERIQAYQDMWSGLFWDKEYNKKIQ